MKLVELFVNVMMEMTMSRKNRYHFTSKQKQIWAKLYMAALRTGKGPVASWIKRYDKLMADKLKILNSI